MVRFKARDGRDPKELAVLDMDSHLKDERLKQKYVATMFDILAPGYDKETDFFLFERPSAGAPADPQTAPGALPSPPSAPVQEQETHDGHPN